VRTLGRAIAVGVAVVLTVAGCANSKTAEPSSGSEARTTAEQPGVTSDTIRVGAVASITNPIGGQYGALADGARAYFDMLNAKGGIYGRKLQLVSERDDQTLQNQSEVQAMLEQDNVFAAIIGTLSFTGAETLVREGVPTFGWNINAEWEKGPNLFGDKGSFFGYTRAYPLLPWLAQTLGAKRIGIISYSVPQSTACAQGDQASIEKYGTAKVSLLDTSLPFGVTDLSADVAAMKQRGVDLVLTCLDQNGAVSLAREMRKQAVEAPLYLTNAYDQTFVAKFASLLQSDYVMVQFTPFEIAESQQPPGLRQFLAQLRKADKEPSEVALAGWLSADMLVTGLRAAGPDFTRQRVIDALNKTRDYDANGILPGIDWTIAHRDDPRQVCYVLLQVEQGKLVPRFGEAAKPFICFDRTAATLAEPVRRA
jgi:ABC-type branched-subunit amino acid transport system substrate-binding protein